MVKLLMTILICSMFMTTSSAQQQNPTDSRYKKYAGRYGNSSGISLFEDGTYLLYGYATAVFGTYRFEKDKLHFSSSHRERFEVFGNYNPSISEGVRIDFVGFERGSRTFAKLDNNGIRPVFNENANCFDAPFVYLNPKKLKQFTLSVNPSIFIKSNGAENTSYTYENKEAYNDFIFIHNDFKREQRDFTAVILETDKGDIIKLSNYGGETGYAKQKEGKYQRQWKEILDMKNSYEQEQKVNQDIIYANQHYKNFPKPDDSSYVFDTKKNLYIARESEENKVRYMQDQYNDPSYIRQYQRLTPQVKKKSKLNDENLPESLFFTVCGEGSDRSYHYNGFIEYKIMGPQPEPVILQPVKPQKQEK